MPRPNSLLRSVNAVVFMTVLLTVCSSSSNTTIAAAPVASAANIELVGTYNTPGRALGVAVAGNYAYVADGETGLRVINVSNPAAPAQIGFYDTTGMANDVAVVGNYVYVADGLSGLRVVNVSNPASPTEVGSYVIPGGSEAYAQGIAVVGNYAYVAGSSTGGLRIVNIANPTAPSLVGFYDSPGMALDVAVAGNYAYVADGSAGLRVINISNPAAPSAVGSYTSAWAQRVAVVGNYAYVVAQDHGLRVLNVSNPATPTEVGSYDTPSYAIDIAVSGNYAYIADYNSVRVVNVSNPAVPTEAGFYDTTGIAQKLAVAGEYIYLANDTTGLSILRFTSPGTISGKITCAASGSGLGGVTVAVGNYSQTTNSDGTYSLNVPAGTYTVKASPGTADNYYTNRQTGVSVVEGSTTTVNLKLSAISANSIDTLIVANFQRMKDLGYTGVDNLKAKLYTLKDADPNETNMTAVIVDLSDGSAPISITNAYTAWNKHEGDAPLTNTLVRAIRDYIRQIKTTQYPNIAYLILVGAHEVIPLALKPGIDDGTGDTERSWIDGFANLADWGQFYNLYHGGIQDYLGRYPTDSLYADTQSNSADWDDEQLTPDLAVGRLVEKPLQIGIVVDAYLLASAGGMGQIRAGDSVVIASKDGLDDGNEAAKHLAVLDTNVTKQIACIGNGITARTTISQEHGIDYIASHGSYSFMDLNNSSSYLKVGTGSDQDHGYVGRIPTLGGAVILADACHVGVNVGEHLSTDDRPDFPENFATKGAIVYIAPTGYSPASGTGCGPLSLLAYSEVLFNYILEFLADQSASSIGDAFVKAKNIYRASDYWFSDNDRKVMAITTLYGIPNAKIRRDGTTNSSPARSKYPALPNVGRIVPASPKPPPKRGLMSTTINLDIPSYTLNGSAGLVEIPGARQVSALNNPILPSVLLEKVLPSGSTVSNINLLTAQSSYVDVPFQVSIGGIATSARTTSGVFTGTGFYPSSLWQTATGSTIAGKGVMIGLNVMPVQYNQQTNTVRMWQKMVLEVTYSVAASSDTDGDGLPDYWEQNYTLDPFNDSGDNGANADIDGDGLTNLQEYTYGTNPRVSDTDGDGYSDGMEVAYGSDPNNPFSKPRFTNYLPFIGNPVNSISGISGRVTVNGAAVAGIPLHLYFYSGSSWTDYASVNTNPEGTYSFAAIPSLGNGQYYQVLFLNENGEQGRLAYFEVALITSYTAGTTLGLGDFDVADVSLVSPANGASVAPPYTFQWTPRPGTPSDIYQLYIYETSAPGNWWRSPSLGNLGSYALSSLPTSFSIGREYSWMVFVYTPGVGTGQSHTRRTTFSSSGVGAKPSLVPRLK